MKWLMEWSSRIPRELAKSQALLGRRKSGKTAIMQRLFNVLWNQNGQVIPFYFEVRDSKMWLLEFAKSYFYTFLSHYFSFVYRKPLPANIIYWDWERLVEMAHTHGNDEVIYQMKVFQSYVNDESTEQAIDFISKGLL
jgi:hypothetical protein